MATLTHARSAPGVDALPLVIVVTSWALMVLLLTGGHASLLAHDAVLSGHTLPPLSTLALFLAAWQVMTGAMMLPSTVPLVRLFARASRGQEHPHTVVAVFLAAYFAVWTGFALAALASDGMLHIAVGHWAWLEARPSLIAGTVSMLAGAFQFSPLKERCLDACRSPLGFLYQHYRRGPQGAWNLGIRHGLFCLGCCWALMLVMFAVGIGSIAGMAGLTGVMTIEKSFPWGRRLVPIVGIALIGWGIGMLLVPSVLPLPLRL